MRTFNSILKIMENTEEGILCLNKLKKNKTKQKTRRFADLSSYAFFHRAELTGGAILISPLLI